MAEKRPYVGGIKHTGSQFVSGPYANTDAKKGKVQKGNDLRTGGKDKKGK